MSYFDVADLEPADLLTFEVDEDTFGTINEQSLRFYDRFFHDLDAERAYFLCRQANVAVAMVELRGVKTAEEARALADDPELVERANMHVDEVMPTILPVPIHLLVQVRAEGEGEEFGRVVDSCAFHLPAGIIDLDAMALEAMEKM